MSEAQLKWVLQMALAAVSLYGLLQNGRRRGWI